jgi:uncharacterized membrane protein YcjF (UPF0283 family)
MIETILSTLNNPYLHQDWVPLAALIAGYVFVVAVWNTITEIRRIWGK